MVLLTTLLPIKRSVALRAGDIGIKTTITAALTLRDGKRVQTSTTIAPTGITIILDADTLTPVWYQGRPEPSIGSTVQATVIPEDGSGQSPESYSYTWRLNNNVIDGGSIKGKYIQKLTMPTGNAATLAVDVSNARGEIIGSKAIAVQNQEPELQFYEVNPLRGMSRIALGDTAFLVGSEMSVRTEPFFYEQ